MKTGWQSLFFVNGGVDNKLSSNMSLCSLDWYTVHVESMIARPRKESEALRTLAQQYVVIIQTYQVH